MNKERRLLRRAVDERLVVRVERDGLVPDEPLIGFVIDTDRAWTLLLLVTDSMLDGYVLLRTRDVTSVRTRGKRDVDRRWQKRHGTWPPPAPRLSLAGTRELLEQAAGAYPLVAVFQEELDPDFALIGKVASLGKKSLRLQEIDSTAEWRRKPTKLRYTDLTRIDFADHYHGVLLDLGGAPPRLATDGLRKGAGAGRARP
ncbi:hypothetical protein H9Y04_29120 [Streptomyces sp. TRM66268-LWL]|uniref:Uncharacterized protein n=1 Tax=Streptomyces polyasparticus TaxID=2767826 RepID=A0ABR7SM85_9ACTN|nr:hypothetical protein [Streptomyces polyasparticus]MBC9716601.1 hypothetical protein [Streptomyces polyasparticus]